MFGSNVETASYISDTTLGNLANPLDLVNINQINALGNNTASENEEYRARKVTRKRIQQKRQKNRDYQESEIESASNFSGRSVPAFIHTDGEDEHLSEPKSEASFHPPTPPPPQDLEKIVFDQVQQALIKAGLAQPERTTSQLDDYLEEEVEDRLRSLNSRGGAFSANFNIESATKRQKELEHWRMKLSLDEQELQKNASTFIEISADVLEGICKQTKFKMFETESLSSAVEEAVKDGRFSSSIRQYTNTGGGDFMKHPLVNFVTTFLSISVKNHLTQKKKKAVSSPVESAPVKEVYRTQPTADLPSFQKDQPGQTPARALSSLAAPPVPGPASATPRGADSWAHRGYAGRPETYGVPSAPPHTVPVTAAGYDPRTGPTREPDPRPKALVGTPSEHRPMVRTDAPFDSQTEARPATTLSSSNPPTAATRAVVPRNLYDRSANAPVLGSCSDQTAPAPGTLGERSPDARLPETPCDHTAGTPGTLGDLPAGTPPPDSVTVGPHSTTPGPGARVSSARPPDQVIDPVSGISRPMMVAKGNADHFQKIHGAIENFKPLLKHVKQNIHDGNELEEKRKHMEELRPESPGLLD